MAMIFVIRLCSCATGDTPVDQYVRLLDEAAEKAEKINSMASLMNVKEIISQESANKIMRDNADYELTDSDKDKLKQSYSRLIKVTYAKTAEYGEWSEDFKKQMQVSIDHYIEAANRGIDRARTLGELSGL